jgi:hypothetical protein
MAIATHWYVYVLKDPTTGDVRYVGWTADPEKRLRTHINSSRLHKPKTYKACWIRSLLVRGLQPLMEVVESGFGDPAPAEMRWIAAMRAAGAKLTNATDGGDGTAGYRFTEEGRRKLSESHRGYVMPPEQIERLRASQKARPMTPERLRRLRESAAGMRRQISAASIQKMAESKRGKKQSPETVEKRRQSHVGKRMSLSARESMKQAAKARCSTPHGADAARLAARHARKVLFDARHKDQLWLTLSL